MRTKSAGREQRPHTEVIFSGSFPTVKIFSEAANTATEAEAVQ